MGRRHAVIDPGPAPWHALAVADAVESLATDPEVGLTEAEAAGRIARHGPNVVVAAPRPSLLRMLVDQLRDVLVGVLVGAALIAGVALDEWVDAAVILAIVALNTSLGFVQRLRAEQALAALQDVTAPEATVRRDGAERRIAARDLVPGDLLTLEAGARVPADARLVEARHLRTEEAALTGESVPASKRVAPAARDAVLGERHSMVFTGTSVVAGTGRALVVATGSHTALGAIAQLAEEQQEAPTPLQRELAAVGRLLALFAVAVAAVVFLLGELRGFPADEMFLTAVALGVAAIPEGLPAVVTITLAQGVRRMAEAHALVRRLAAVETLGSTSVICTDKTGTLTRNTLRVQHTITVDGATTLSEMQPETRRAFARVAALCSDARPDAEGGRLGDPVEIALLVALEDAAEDVGEIRALAPRLDEAAFDSSRKRMSTLHRLDGAGYLAVKGAPEHLLRRCTAARAGSGVVPLDEPTRRRLAMQAEELGRAGLRTLALAERAIPEPVPSIEEVEHELVWIALVGMIDEPRAESPASVALARQAGATVLMVTGDHAATARAIASQVGILDGGEVLDGAELHDMTPEQLAAAAERFRVFARVDPADKVKIVQAWRARGAIVAMTGDGVNDAPALRAADIGVAMGSGTDVGKEAADMVLADDNFATIVAAIREGRRIYANLEKIVWFLLSANAAEVLLITVSLLVFGHLGSPLLATQILWINLVTDGLPVLALSVDPAPLGVMDRPPRQPGSLLERRAQRRMLERGAILAAGAFAVLVYGYLLRDQPWAEVRTLVFSTLVGVQLAYAIVIRHLGVGTGAVPRNRWLLLTVGLSVLLQVAVVSTGWGHDLFDTVSLSLGDWAVAALLSVAAPLAILALSRHDERGTELVRGRRRDTDSE